MLTEGAAAATDVSTILITLTVWAACSSRIEPPSVDNRVRRDLHAFRRGQESEARHTHCHCAGLLNHRVARGVRCVRCAADLAGFAAIPGYTHCVCACCRVGRRRLAFSTCERNFTGGDHRVGHGLTVGRGPTPVCDGPQQRYTEVFFWRARSRSANASQQRSVCRRIGPCWRIYD